MSECPTCGLPMVWSTEREETWCCIYGTHRQKPRGEFASLVRLCMETADTSRRGLHNRGRRGYLRSVA